MANVYGDIGKREQETVGSLPKGIVNVDSLTLPIDAGATNHVIFGTNPANERLSLWNYLISVYVDTDNDYRYLFPFGSRLSLEQKNLQFSTWTDWGESSDLTNARLNTASLYNYGSVAHTYYVKFKAYSYANAIG